MTPLYKKSRKEDLGNHGLVSLTSVRGKLIDQLECHHAIHTGKSINQMQPAWIYDGLVLPD